MFMYLCFIGNLAVQGWLYSNGSPLGACVIGMIAGMSLAAVLEKF